MHNHAVTSGYISSHSWGNNLTETRPVFNFTVVTFHGIDYVGEVATKAFHHCDSPIGSEILRKCASDSHSNYKLVA